MNATKEVRALRRQYAKHGRGSLYFSYGQATVNLYSWLSKNNQLFGTVEITKLFVNPTHRSSGHGTRTMKILCKWADHKQLYLFLQAIPINGGPLDTSTALMKWYRKFGFQFNEYLEGTRKPRK